VGLALHGRANWPGAIVFNVAMATDFRGHSVRRAHPGRADPYAVPAARRPQAHLTPDGTELAPSSKPQPDGTLVKALVRAWRWRRLIDERRFGTLADLADTERISRSYGCRVLCLTLLAPDVIERIPDGRPTARARAVPEAVPGRLGAAARVVHSERRLICQGKRSLEESKFGSAGGSRKPSTSRPSARARTRRGDRASMYSTSGNRRPRRILSTFTIKVRPD
jgi:hypothetical protein